VSDGTWATGVNIRGLSKQNVVYLIDGNRIETSTNLTAGLSLIDISNVESIEIVKGGLSSLFGTGATGGVINIKTHQSSINDSFLLSGALSSSFASVNNGKVVSLRLNASDKIWFATFATTMRNADDTKIPSGILTNSGFKDNSLSVSGGFLPIENLELKFNYQKFNATDVGIPGGTPFPTGAKASYPTASRELYSGEIVIKQLSKTVNNLKFKYYSQIIKREVEIIPNPNVIVAPQANHKTNGLLLQANCTFAKNHFLISGIEWWQRSYIGERSKTIIPKKKVIIDKPVPNSKFATLGFFVNDELHLFQNRLKLNIGGRYDFIRVTNEKTNNPIAIITNGVVVTPPPNIDASYDAYSVDNKSWSGNIGILYSLFEDVNLTFNSAYTFRSPSLEERYQYIDLGSTVYYGNPNLEPEQGQSFDFGFRVWKENLTFTIDGFVNIFDNLVIDQPISDTSFQKQNVGKARFIGFDTKIEYNFYKRYVAYASLAYVDGKDTEANESLPQIPPLNGSLGIKIPIQNFLIIDFASTFYNKQNKISSNEKRTPGYIYFDFALNSYPIRFSLLDIQILAGVENIFDVAYKSHLSTYRGINLTEPGRNIYAKVKLSW
jgi:hemoglobin/transferrin/lactoferrin receptor protein